MIDKIKTSAQMGAAAKACGSVSDNYNKYDIHSLMLTINYNAALLNKLTDQVNELKEAVKTKNFEVEENTGAAVEEEIKEDIEPDIKKLIEALKEIKNICKGQKRCDNCIFYKKIIDCCLFEEDGCLFKTPERWKI